MFTLLVNRLPRAVFRIMLLSALLVISTHARAALDIQSWQTGKGAKVLLVENRALPMLDIRVVFDAGSARDDGKYGLAQITNSLLDEGAGGMSAQQLAEAFESVGAEVSLESLRDMAYAGLRTLTEQPYMDRALATFKKVLSQPDFTRKAFERQLARFKVAVKSREQSPADIAEEAYYKALYGDHPYANPVSGDAKSLQAITLDDVKAYYRKYYVARNAVIAIVGNVSREQAQTIVDNLLAELPAGETPPAIPAVKPLQHAKTVFIDYPSAQSHIFIGQPAIKRGDKNHFNLYVANHPFGGSGFASRLVNVIREQRGLAYSVYSYFSPMREAGPFTMGMQTKNEQAAEAIELLGSELKKYIASGPDEDEMEKSISNITGSFPLNLDSNSKILGYIAMIGFYHLPLDYLDNFLDNIRAVTRDSARQAFADAIHPDKMVTVVVGKNATRLDGAN